MRAGGGEEFYFERECKRKKKSHSAGKKESLSPKGEWRRISKAQLAKGNKEVKAGIGIKGTKGMVRRLSKDTCEICAP